MAAFGFLLPNFAGFLAFTFLPVVVSFWMAFTNWSLKPAVKFQYIGMRNFVDLVGARPIDHPAPMLFWAFVCCAVICILGMVGLLWANIANWNGTRSGNAILAVGSLVFVGLGIDGAWYGLMLAGLIGVACGLAGTFKDSPWKLGRGTIPGTMAVLGAICVWSLSYRVAAAYAPSDPDFWQYFYNTAFLMLGIPFTIAGSLGVALLLNNNLPTGSSRTRIIGALACLLGGIVFGALLWVAGHNPNAGLICGVLWVIAALGFLFNVVAFRTLYYLPTFTSGVAQMILWKALYNPKTGPINLILDATFHALHIHAALPQWLGSVDWAKPALIIMGIWTGIGSTNMLLYLAALTNVPAELLDAANVDGAGPWKRFQHVLLPQLAPTTFFITIMSIIGGLQGGFDQARVMTNGGPAGATTTLTYYIYNKAFQDLDFGYASAISWVLFAIIFIATALNWKFGKGLETE
jgi:ABC-type sugar transport system permease subunit